jgi:uncharacterized membrane protein
MTGAPTGTAPACLAPTPWLRRGIAALAALILLEVLWELLLAPVRPGGSWLALKALPLALLWLGLSRGVRRAGQWLSLLLPLYAAEALVRALTEVGRHRIVALTVLIVAVAAWGALLAALRKPRHPAPRTTEP